MDKRQTNITFLKNILIGKKCLTDFHKKTYLIKIGYSSDGNQYFINKKEVSKEGFDLAKMQDLHPYEKSDSGLIITYGGLTDE
jgi:hypothetical protein